MDTKKLRQKILDLAIRGKLVPQDPNDEPASVLLERIKAEKERLIKEGKIKRSKKSTSDTSHYKNVPFEIPKSWVWTTIEEVTPSLQYGTSEKSKSSGEIAVLRMGNITRKGTIDYSDLVYTSNKVDIEKLRLKTGDILFNRTNSSEWVGKTAIYRGEVPSIYAGYIIRMTPIFLDCEYVNMVMNSQYERDWCNFVKTDGVNQSNINSQKLSQFYIPIPPIEEQKRIVETANYWLQIVESIESNKKDIINTITKAKQEVLRKAICGELVSQDPDDEPASKLLMRINPDMQIPCDNPHYPFETPKSWCWCKVQDVFVLNPKNDVLDNNVCGFIPMALVDDGFGSSHKYEIKKWSDVKKGYAHFQNGDIGIAKISPCFENRKSIVFENLPNNTGAGTSELTVLRSMDVYNKFFLYLFQSNWYIHEGTKYFKGVVGQQRVHKDIFTTLEIPIPPLEEQKRIVAEIERYFSVLDKIKESLTA